MLLAWALWSCAAPRTAPLFDQGRSALSPVGAGAPTGAAECGTCHPEQLAGWQESRHARAWTGPHFQASFARARMRPWCTRCHAPLRSETQASGDIAPATAVAEGVTCVVCHQREGLLLSARLPTEAARRAHPIRHEPTLGRSELCGGCHQFAVPVLDRFPIEETAVQAQDTLGEWERSGTKASCQQCHFENHRAWGAHDLRRLAGALRVEVESGVLTLSLRGVGHALPTGDPFRWLALELCADERCAATLKRWTFARLLVPQGQQGSAPQRVEVAQDTRLFPGRPRSLPVPGGARYWRLVYHYAEPGLSGHVPEEELGAVVAAGPL